MRRYLGLVLTLWPRWVPRRTPIHPDFIPDPDYFAPAPVAANPSPADERGVYPGAKQQPFYNGNDPSASTLETLLLSMSTVISSFTSSASIATSTSIDLQTLTLASETDAQLGCSIYEQYQTYCQVGSISSATCSPGLQDLYCQVPPSEQDLFASCACYSGTMWVPDLYDNAIWACDQYTDATSLPHWDTTVYGPTYTTTSDNQAQITQNTVVWGFCADNNPRNLQSASGFGVAAATSSASPSPGSSPASSPSVSSPSPTQSNGASTVVALRHGGVSGTLIIVMLALLVFCLCLA